ncbi:MAG: DUF1684 domain-containing protein [Bacteroidales bacterium]
MKNFYSIGVAIFLVLVMSSCKSNKQKMNEEEYIQSVKEWQQNRLERLKSENGWLNLVGLHWLKEGENPFGSSDANNIAFPEKAPEFIGSYSLYKDNLSVRIEPDIDVYINDSLIKEHDVFTDADKNTTYFKLGDYRWHIIKRGDRYGIRLRDLKSPLLEKITEIPSFPIDLKWRVKATFEPFEKPKEIAVPNYLGSVDYEKCYGLLKFTINDQELSLMPLGDGVNENFFLIFGDETSAEETYGAGRFLSVEKPDKNGITYIDFNKATNPPCAFTDYATCPLPPKENILPVKILAGEKTNEFIGHH